MAGVAATKFQTIRTMVRTASGFGVFGNNPTFAQVRFVKLPSSPDAAKRDIDELKEKVASQTDYAANQSKEAVEKVKQSAKEGWDATKDVAQKVQNTVVEKAEASADIVKDNIELAKKNMNTKK